MIAFALIAAAACTGILLAGYLLGRMHARRLERTRRGGMLPLATPQQVADRWNFPAAPKLYDQEASHAMTDTSIRTMAAALDATVTALDPHSRRVPDGDIRSAERRYETWLETNKDHGP